MRAELFTDQAHLTDLGRYAQGLDLDVPRFQECLERGTYQARVRQSQAEGVSAGVSGTPTFFLGVSDRAGSVVRVIRVLRGAQPYQRFQAAIDSVLASQP